MRWSTRPVATQLVANVEPVENVFVDDLEVAEAISMLKRESEKAGTPDELLDTGWKCGNFFRCLAGPAERFGELPIVERTYRNGLNPIAGRTASICLKIRPRSLADGTQNCAG